ncbi:MAG TPA: hypothetical protein VGV93_07570 [Acidimicrobiales bacterium]|nr:hypothetical protein [Acidimicrobiales bacterium]
MVRPRGTTKASAVCREREEGYGLTVVDGRTAGSKPGVTRGEDEKANRMGTVEPERVRLERPVRASASSSRDEGEFVRRLRSDGVLCRPRYAKNTQAWWWATPWSPAGAASRSGSAGGSWRRT